MGCPGAFKEGDLRGRICVTVLEGSPDRARELLSRFSDEGYRVELRLDGLEEDPAGMLPLGIPRLIVTNRRREEGGLFSGSEEERLRILREASQQAEFVDVEWSTPARLRKEFFRKVSCGTILSYHNISHTPSLETLMDIYTSMKRCGADIYKIVTMVREAKELLVLLNLLQLILDKGEKAVVFPMGRFAKVGRVLSLLLGSPFTYARPDGGMEGAPGQPTPSEILELLEVIK